MQLVTRLLRLMDSQLANYERLHDLLARKRAAIEANDLHALAQAAQEIEQLIGHNSQLEEQRQVEAAAVAAKLGMRGPRPTVTRLLKRLAEPDKTALAERSAGLRAALQTLKVETRTIRTVLSQNLDLIDGLMRSMLNAAPEPGTYVASGAGADSSGMRLLDQTA